MDVDVILDTRAKPQELKELGRLAERFGLDGIWVSSLLDSRDPFANLSLLALNSTRIRLGPIAVNPFDTHPVRIASGLLTLNEMARGRARIVTGGVREALQSLGLEPHRRVRAVRECLDILRGAARGERMSYDGELYRVRNLHLRWLEAPPPALYAGASQEQMLKMAATAADGIMMSDMPPGPAAAAIATLDAGLTSHGRQRRDFATSVFTAWHVYPDRRQALLEARRWLLLRGIFRPWLLAEFLTSAEVKLVMNSEAAFARAFAAGSPDVEGVPEPVLNTLAEHVALVGTPARLEPVLERLQALRAAGLGSVALRLYADPAESIRLLGRRVRPALQSG